MSSDSDVSSSNDIAVVGMAGRFPGASDLDEFWQLIRQGREGISFFSDQELVANGVHPRRLKDSNYVRAKGILADADAFDAGFFGYAPAEAKSIDPQQRVFLECAWHALEDAGYDPLNVDALVGVYGGARFNTYAFGLKAGTAYDAQDLDEIDFLTGNDKDYLTTRVSFKLGLRGASVNVQSACSTSLVSVVLGIQSLQNFENDVVLAGGVRVSYPLKAGYQFSEDSILSSDGHCRTFDVDSSGTVFSDGVGIVVLKRLADAIRDRDRIRAVIKGGAVNNDGRLRAGFTAPSVTGQADVIAMALENASVEPETVGYIECHGTATQLGDPIEVTALTQVFRSYTAKNAFCVLGSVKPNIGHLSAAAGIAGLIKTILMLERREIPPLALFRKQNPALPLSDDSPFIINTELREWQTTGSPRRAGVSSFGLGGTNAHVVLEEAPRPHQPIEHEMQTEILPISARSRSTLDQTLHRLSQHVQNSSEPLLNIAYTLQSGRTAFKHRRAIVTREGAAPNFLGDDTIEGAADSTAPDVVFLFPGQGVQIPGIARDLSRSDSAFAEAIETAVSLLPDSIKDDIRLVLFETGEKARLTFLDTSIAQPALFILQYALARRFTDLGVRPSLLIGHSVGEYAAAHFAGILTLKDALKLLVERGRLLKSTGEGSMLALALGIEEAHRLLVPGCNIAAFNAPDSVVVSGHPAAIDALAASAENADLPFARLQTSRAFHSALVEPILSQFQACASAVAFSPAEVPVVSTVTGMIVPSGDVMDADYWTLQLRQPVRFQQAIMTALEKPGRVFLEIGPDSTLSRLAQRNDQKHISKAIIPAMDGSNDLPVAHRLARSVARLWAIGVPIKWDAWRDRSTSRRVALPLTSFERTRHSFDPPRYDATDANDRPPATIGRRAVDRWLYQQAWRPAKLDDLPATPAGQGTVLILVNHNAFGVALEREVRQQGWQTVKVTPGAAFRDDGAEITVDPSEENACGKLAELLTARGVRLGAIFHAWLITDQTESHDRTVELGFNTLLNLSSAFVDGADDPPSVVAFSRQLFGVVPGDDVSPNAALLQGPIKVIPQEYPHARSRLVDLPAGRFSIAAAIRAALAPSLGDVVALRREDVYVPFFEPVPKKVREDLRLRDGGTYLITGGLGGIGLSIATYLARNYRANLILTGREGLPEPATWERLLAERDPNDRVCKRIRSVLELRKLGADVTTCCADTSDARAMGEVVKAAIARFSTIDGAIHAAGLPGSSLLSTLSATKALAVLRPKTQGALVLADVLRAASPKFIALCSSHNSVLGRVGQSDYCAANAFLDAMATAGLDYTHVVSLNWGAWKDVGMAVDTVVPQELKDWRERTLADAISPREGAEAFELAVTTGLRQVIISVDDFQTVVERHLHSEQDRIGHALHELAATKPTHVQSEGRVDYVAPRNDLERQIARIWEQVLGVATIGIRDDFLSLGGHSLVATKLLARLRKETGAHLSLRDFMAAPTIAGISEALKDGADQHAPSLAAPTITRVARLQSANVPQLAPSWLASDETRTPLGFSLFFFSACDTSQGRSKYDLLMSCARFADERGFEAIWTPERHFNNFGGLYANPAITGAALAATTSRVGIRAGSVILPLHHPVRVAEEWSMVDNLSGGRTAIAFGSGWHVNDFVLAPDAHQKRKDVMLKGIEVVQKLWRGETIAAVNGANRNVTTRTFPRPTQKELPIWLTAESPDSFVTAGKLGFNVLTALLHQSMNDLEKNIAAYRQAYVASGRDPRGAKVTLMQHTFVGDDEPTVLTKAKAGYTEYVRSNMLLQSSNAQGIGGEDFEAASEADIQQLADRAFDRIQETTGLVGTVESCVRKVQRLRQAGVNEIACLIDFMPNEHEILEMLEALDRLRLESAAHSLATTA